MPQTGELPTTQDPMEASVCGHWGECDLGAVNTITASV